MERKIQTTLEQIRQGLNDAFMQAEPRDDDWVVLTSFVDLDGQPNAVAHNKVVMFVANIQRETTDLHTHESGSGPPPLYVDISVMFVANFEPARYSDGLGAISRTISYFQQHPVFTHSNMPKLEPVIGRLKFEMVNLTTVDVNNLIALAGISYHPLVMYNIRMIPFGAANGEPTPI